MAKTPCSRTAHRTPSSLNSLFNRIKKFREHLNSPDGSDNDINEIPNEPPLLDNIQEKLNDFRVSLEFELETESLPFASAKAISDDKIEIESINSSLPSLLQISNDHDHNHNLSLSYQEQMIAHIPSSQQSVSSPTDIFAFSNKKRSKIDLKEFLSLPSPPTANNANNSKLPDYYYTSPSVASSRSRNIIPRHLFEQFSAKKHSKKHAQTRSETLQNAYARHRQSIDLDRNKTVLRKENPISIEKKDRNTQTRLEKKAKNVCGCSCHSNGGHHHSNDMDVRSRTPLCQSTSESEFCNSSHLVFRKMVSDLVGLSTISWSVIWHRNRHKLHISEIVSRKCKSYFVVSAVCNALWSDFDFEILKLFKMSWSRRIMAFAEPSVMFFAIENKKIKNSAKKLFEIAKTRFVGFEYICLKHRLNSKKHEFALLCIVDSYYITNENHRCFVDRAHCIPSYLIRSKRFFVA